RGKRHDERLSRWIRHIYTQGVKQGCIRHWIYAQCSSKYMKLYIQEALIFKRVDLASFVCKLLKVLKWQQNKTISQGYRVTLKISEGDKWKKQIGEKQIL